MAIPLRRASTETDTNQSFSGHKCQLKRHMIIIVGSESEIIWFCLIEILRMTVGSAPFCKKKYIVVKLQVERR